MNASSTAAAVLRMVRTATVLALLGWGGPSRASDGVPPAERRVRYGFTLQNTRDAMMPRADLWTYAPAADTASQRCTLLRASHPYRLMKDDAGNRILHFSFEHLPPYAVKVVTIDATLAPGDALADEAEVRARFLGPSRLMEVDDPEFAALARGFRPRDGDPVPEQAYRFVRRSVQDGGYDPVDRGALYALQHGRGDCTEFASVFGALCRAQGVPARMIGGYLCGEGGLLDSRAYHNWAEFYCNGAWQVADCQKGFFGPGAGHYVAMHIFTDEESALAGYPRFRHEGVGLKVTMNEQ